MPWKLQSAEERFIISLLRDDGEKAKSIADTGTLDYDLMFRYLYDHRISGVFCYKINSLLSRSLPKPVIALCKMTILKRMEMSRLRWKELENICAVLRERSIPVTLLKGFALDPSPQSLRQFNDVDILIPEDRILEAAALLKDKGYNYRGSDILSDKEKNDIPSQLSWNNQYQFRCPGSPLEIEVHTNLFERDRVRLEDLNPLLNRSELFRKGQTWHEELNCFFPCPEASLALLCLHTALKRSPANNTYILRQAYDMENLLSSGIDGDYFLSLCEAWNIGYYAAFALNLQKIIMDKGEEDLIQALEVNLSGKEKKLMLVHLACFRDLSRNSLWYMLRYRVFMPFVIGNGLKKSLYWYFRALFPTRISQEKKYNIPYNSPFIYVSYLLNPFRGLWLLIRQLISSKRRMP